MLAPVMLWGLLAVSIPAMIHLWQRRQVQTIRFSSLRLLKAVAQKTRRLSRVENLLLLFLRCLLLALLALAFAEPAIRSATTLLPGGNVEGTVVLIIDSSMSMNYLNAGKPRLETAKQEAQTVLRTLKKSDRVAVLATNNRSQPLPEPSFDHDVAGRAIDQIHPTEGGSTFSQTLLLAKKTLADSPPGRRQVFVFTDNQETAWKFDTDAVFDKTWKDADIELVVVQPDQSKASNASVRRAAIQTRPLLPDSKATLAATVANQSQAPLEDVLSLALDGKRIAQQSFHAGSNALADLTIDFQAPSLNSGWVAGYAEIGDDNLPDDNRFYFTVPVYQSPRVLIVSALQPGMDRTQPDFYLRKALSLGAGETSSIPTSSLTDQALDRFSVVYLADPGPINDRAIVQLDRFLEKGGTVVYFPGNQTSGDSTGNLDFLPGSPGPVRDATADMLSTTVTDPADPLFATVWDAATPFPAVPQKTVMDWQLKPSAKVLVTLGDQTPFIASERRGAGLTLLVNATADRAWGDFPLSPAFLPLLQQINLLSASGSSQRAAFTVGESVPRPPGLPPDQNVTLTFPDHTTKTVEPANDSLLLDEAEQPGIYEAHTEAASYMFAVNVDPRESDLTPITPAALEKIIPQTLLTTPEELQTWLATEHHLRPLWPIVLLLAALVFAAEFLIANFFASKRTQSGAPTVLSHVKTSR